MTFLSVNNTKESDKADTTKASTKGNTNGENCKKWVVFSHESTICSHFLVTLSLSISRKNFCGLSENCVQACAWVLLTIGLCFIVVTFYLAINEKNNKSARNFDIASEGLLHEGEENLLSASVIEPNYDFNSEENLLRFNHDSEWMDSPRNSRWVIDAIVFDWQPAGNDLWPLYVLQDDYWKCIRANIGHLNWLWGKAL